MGPYSRKYSTSSNNKIKFSEIYNLDLNNTLLVLAILTPTRFFITFSTELHICSRCQNETLLCTGRYTTWSIRYLALWGKSTSSFSLLKVCFVVAVLTGAEQMNSVVYLLAAFPLDEPEPAATSGWDVEKE